MSNLKRINGDKLRKILYSMEPDSLGRKRTLADFSREIGYGSSYLAQATSGVRTLNAPARKLLESMYGIKEEDYIYDDRPQVTRLEGAPVPQDTVVIGRDELEDIVRTAVTKAFNEVLTRFFLLQEDNVENRREVNYAE